MNPNDDAFGTVSTIHAEITFRLLKQMIANELFG